MTDQYQQELEDIEIKLLLEGVFRHYGYDFRDYAATSLKRRIRSIVQAENLQTVSALQEKLLHNVAYMERFLLSLTINVTAMFRDPKFHLAFREMVVPYLRELPFIRIWHAGCATGEEVHSMAILLHEESLYDKSRIYATDMNETVLKRAKSGIFPLAEMQQYTDNYLQAGGKRSFSLYYTASYDNAIFTPSLQKNIVWSQHNLVTDRVFNEFHVILCRNVLIYFNPSLQNLVHKLLYDSLALFGFLGLGRAELIKFTPFEGCYSVLDGHEKLYRKMK